MNIDRIAAMRGMLQMQLRRSDLLVSPKALIERGEPTPAMILILAVDTLSVIARALDLLLEAEGEFIALANAPVGKEQ